MVPKLYYVYLLCNHTRGSFYVGITNDLVRRVWEHREKLVKGHTNEKNISRLVWFEQHDEVNEAIKREKTIKRWKREWKYNLVEQDNPRWDDLYPGICS
jgi:putative endonuclease